MFDTKEKDEKKVWRILWRAPIVLLATYISSGVLCVSTAKVASLFGYELKPQLALEILERLKGWRLVYFIGYGVILMPVLEELVFRLLLFKLVARFCLWIKAPTGAKTKISLYEKSLFTRAIVWGVALVSSALFMAAHYLGPSPFPDNAFIALVVFGMIQCWVYWRASSIVAPILNHILFNALNIFLFLVCGVR